MAANKVGESALPFGTTTETWGYIENLTEREEVSVREVADNDGDIKAAAFYGKKYNVSFDYVFRTATGAPEAQVGTGTTVTVTDVEANSGAIYITSAENVLTGGLDPDYKRVRCEGIWWPDLG